MGQLPAKVSEADLRLVLLSGSDASSWVDDDANFTRWRSLYDACPWGTSFQTPDFFRVWFRHYGERWRPLLLLCFDREERLRSAFPLAIGDGVITGVGAHQAEYHGWIAQTVSPSRFASDAVDRISKVFPNHDLRLRYLPAKSPTEALDSLLGHNRRVIADRQRRPLMALDEVAVHETLKKKGNRSKVNRLKRLGALSVRAMDAAEFERRLDEIGAMCDFRQGAVNDSCPFSDDPHKGPFHADWVRSMPNDVHVSGMFVDDTLISVLIFALSKDEAHVAITAHSPEHAEHSPGKLHIYEAALTLIRAGFNVIDMTPGGDAWKSRFATHSDEVVDLCVHSSATKASYLRARAAAAKVARSALALVRPQQTVERAETPSSVDAGGWDAYVPTSTLPQTDTVRVNVLSDLLRFGPKVAGMARQAFLAQALARMEAGERCYVLRVRDGVAGIGWSGASEVELRVSGFATLPGADTQALYGALIGRMLADFPRTRLSVPVNDARLKTVVEMLGFQRVAP
jgi:CelD/BcsL family acetyltransferase involved in cellulose biosynthesis